MLTTKTFVALVAAALSISSLAGCAEQMEEENNDVNIKTEDDAVNPTGLSADFIAQNNLTLAGSIPICGSDHATVTGATSSQLFSIFGSDDPSCVPETYNRGTGKPMQCRWDLIRSGAICYRPCKSGYKMVAGVCWQSSCPEGYRDDGAYCAKPAAYGRGAGYALWDEDKCEDRNEATGCEKWGAMWYPKCKEGFHNVGANICSPDCPDGMTDIGVSCQKKTYVQNSSNTTPISYSPFPALNTPIFTAPLNTCPTGTERSGELCYEPCIDGFKGSNDLCKYSGK
jgi:hypothetical protein